MVNELINWYSSEKRDLPWRQNPTPYYVWLSEIILQQTRVQQGLPYFNRFVERFPDVHSLAGATEDEVLKLWEGLGYYSRARNLHHTAKAVSVEYGGTFPKSYNGLLQLKGIGPYTAAAIASICFDLPTPVIDGNVYRVIARLFNVRCDISTGTSRKKFLTILEDLIPSKHPGDFNQALMELGATICTPKAPVCESCPVQQHCIARAKGTHLQFPVKTKKVRVRKRFFHYFVFTHRGRMALKRRKKGDVWQGLYDFHQLEKNDIVVHVPPDLAEISDCKKISETMQHVLTHQRIMARFYHLEIEEDQRFLELVNNLNLTSYSWQDVVNLPRPKLIVNYLNEFEFK